MPNFFSALFRGFTSSGKAAPNNDYGGTWLSLTRGANDGLDEGTLLNGFVEWVYIAVSKVARSTAGVRFKVMRYERNGDDQEVFDGPLVEFLDNPGPGFTGKDFIYLNTVYKELTGNAFWEILKPGKVTPLLPTRVAPIIENGVFVGYKYNTGTSQRTILPEEILHDRDIDPARPYWGVGKLTKIATWFGVSTTTSELLNRFFKNGAVFGGFIETEEESEARIKLVKMGLQNDHVGVANFFKWGVLPKGAKANRNDTSISDMEMGATDDRYRDKILATFGVPKSILGLVQDVNRANAEAMQYVYMKETIEPIVRDFVEFLNTNVAPTLDSSGKYYFSYEDFVPANQDLAIKSRESALNRQPYKTINEVRAEVGLPPVEGGDVVLTSATMTPLGAPEAAPAPAPAPKAAPASRKVLPAHVRKFERKETAFGALEKLAETIVTTELDLDAVAHRAFVGRVEDHLKLIADKVRDFNNRQEREVSQKLTHITRDIIQSDLFDMELEVSVFADFVGPMLRGLMVEQGIEEYQAQGFAGSFDTTATAISDIVRLAARRAAKQYNRTTARHLAKALNEGIKNGESLPALTERVKSVYSYSNAVRAEMVAHTEAFYIANKGSLEAYKQSGVVKSMRWYTAEDERVCTWCGPQNGKVVGVNEVFFTKGESLTAPDGSTLDLNYRTIDVPPLHTRCRCFVRPETIEV